MKLEIIKIHSIRLKHKIEVITVNSLEHGEHGFMVVMVKEPYAWVPIIFLKRHCNYIKTLNFYSLIHNKYCKLLKGLRSKLWNLTCVAVGDIDGAFESGAEQNPNDAFASVFGDSVVVVDDAEQNQWVYYHFLYRFPRYLLRLYHVHCSNSISISASISI